MGGPLGVTNNIVATWDLYVSSFSFHLVSFFGFLYRLV